MSESNTEIKTKILLNALEDVPFDGWTWQGAQAAAVKSGFGEDMALAVFPEKLPSLLQYFSEYCDAQMLAALEDIDFDDLRIRDRIKLSVQTRLKFCETYKEAVRAASTYWLSPGRQIQAGKIVWRTADVIWHRAGDMAQDYNYYSKRGLLSGVITSTTLYWLNDNSENHQDTLAFLERRIENVLVVGKFTGKTISKLKSFLPNLKAKSDCTDQKDKHHV